MPTPVTHGIVAVAFGFAMPRSVAVFRIMTTGAACAMLPDLDMAGYWLGVPYGHPLGHRGFTHSLLFAALLSAVVVAIGFRDFQQAGVQPLLLLYFFLATASHGVLDAFTYGGLGIAFLAPFDNTRYLFPFRPVPASTLDVLAFLSFEGLWILVSEALWIWLPAGVIAAIGRKWSRAGS